MMPFQIRSLIDPSENLRIKRKHLLSLTCRVIEHQMYLPSKLLTTGEENNKVRKNYGNPAIKAPGRGRNIGTGDQHTGLPSSDNEVIFSYGNNPICIKDDDIYKNKIKVNKDEILFTQECYFNDSLCLRAKEERAHSWKRIDSQSEEFDKVLHRTGIKKRTFSPDNDAHTNLFSPLLLHNQEGKNSYQKKGMNRAKNSIKLGSKDSQSQKSSFLQSDMVSRLNSKTYPNPPASGVGYPSNYDTKKSENNKVMPFEKVNEEEESYSKTSIPALHLEKYSEVSDVPKTSKKGKKQLKHKKRVHKIKVKRVFKKKPLNLKETDKDFYDNESSSNNEEEKKPNLDSEEAKKIKEAEYKTYCKILEECEIKKYYQKKKMTFLISCEWLNKWLDYIEADKEHPGSIDNRPLWYLIFNNQEVKRGRDYYVVDRRVWDFLHQIYGGGPILHKDKKEVNSETVSIRSSTTSLGTNIGNIVQTENYQSSFIEKSIGDNRHPIIDEAENEEEDDKLRNDKDEMIQEYINNNIILQNFGEEQIPDDDYDEGEYGDDEGEYEDDESEISNINNAEFNIIGLKNPNNYCYMNVCLQALLSISELVEYYLKINPNDLLSLSKATKKKDNISYLFSEFCHDSLIEDRDDAYNPTALQNHVKKIFSTQMQDTHEFILYFFSKLQDEENKFKKTLLKAKGVAVPKDPDPTKCKSAIDYWNKYKQGHSSIIDKLFTGLMSTSVSRNCCKKVTKNYEPFLDLSCDIQSETVDGCLDNYFKDEKIGQDSEYNCEYCEATTNAVLK